ncbi:MAG TPA: hypothetical protein VFW94_08515, partial [Candidatus Acidoferrales bacterium]|nr:hypothetical protein [Candidatus Acidoferrales bacterium]
PEYVENTSEFNNVKARLMALHDRRKVDNQDSNRPRLRRNPGSATEPGNTKKDDDDRPTLKRRPQD